MMPETSQTNQRMLLAIVTSPDSDNVENALLQTGYSFARLPSVGGLLRERNVTFLIGCPEHETDQLRKLLQSEPTLFDAFDGRDKTLRMRRAKDGKRP